MTRVMKCECPSGPLRLSQTAPGRAIARAEPKTFLIQRSCEGDEVARTATSLEARRAASCAVAADTQRSSLGTIMATVRHIKSAEEWQKDLKREEKRKEKERRDHQRHLEEEAACRDIRDATIAYIKNAGMSFQKVEDLGGPVVRTLVKWQEELVTNPRMTTIRRALRVVGKDIGIVDFRPPAGKGARASA
jgi:hypothetical protein